MNPNHDPDNGQFTTAGQAGGTAPRTSPQHSERHRAAVEDPRDVERPTAIKPAKRVTPLRPEELQELRRASPDGVVTNDDADRRDLGLKPFPRSAGPHLITAPGAQPFPGIHLGGSNVDQLHGRMVYHHHTRIVAEANRNGTNKPGSPTVPGPPDATRPGLYPGFGQAPTRGSGRRK